MKNLKKQKIKIVGMHCTNCAMTIDGDLEDYVAGVVCANTNYARQETEVEYDPTKVNLDQIVKQIKKTGYEAEVAEG
jgi:Cu+-exporting ATPase